MKLIRVTISLLLMLYFGLGQSTEVFAAYTPITVEEEDGSPSVKETKKIIVESGTLTNLNNGTLALRTNGDITSAANIADNVVVRGDGGAKGIQGSGITIDDSDNVTGLNSINVDGTTGNTVVVDTTTLVVDAANDRVGIGTASPTQQLEITGNFKMPTTSSTVGTVYAGSNRFLHGYGTNGTFLGIDAGNLTLTGQDNTGVGDNSLTALKAGSYNTAFGSGALSANTNGDNNTAIGTNSLLVNTTGTHNTAVGRNTLAGNKTGNYNVAFGSSALLTNNGDHNLALGYMSGYNQVQADNNNFIGNYSGFSNKDGNSNIGLGVSSSYNAKHANNNVALGYESLMRNVNGSNLVAVGFRAGYGVAGRSSYNGTYLGHRAGYAVSNGTNNIFVGYQAGDNVTLGNSNIIIGDNIDAPSATASNQLNIGNTIYGDTAAKNVGIGANISNEKLTVNGNLSLKEGAIPSATSDFGKVYVDAGNSRLYFRSSAGNIYSLTNGSSANVAGSNTWFQFNDGGALGGNGALTFTKGTRILAVANDTPFDINTTTLSIADSDITLDGASTTFTQSSGAITLAPAAGSNVNLTLSGAGDFAVATNKLYVDTSASAVGINKTNPATALDVTGTINATGQVNGVTANFTTVNSTTINNSGTTNTGKLLASTNINGADLTISNTATFSSMTAGSVPFFGTAGLLSQDNANFFYNNSTDALYLGAASAGAADIILNNGGSAVFNEQGNAVSFRVESDTNANMLFVDGANDRVGIGTATPSTALDINGGLRVRAGSPQANFVLASVDTTGTTNWKSVSDILNDGGAFLNALNDAISDKSSNLFLGNGSGLTNSGEYNTSVGILSMGANTSGNGNTALGYRAGNPNTVGNYNTAIGTQTLNGNDNGIGNIALGYKSLYTTNGDYNIGLGYQAGDNITTGNRNITIGYDLNAVSATADDQLNIGSAIFGNLSTGNIGIGANNPSAFKLQVTGNIGPTTNNTYDLGSSAIKFANAYANNFNGAAANISTINSATINNTGSAHIAGTVNGGTFDGDFTNGSILFSNAAGVISQNNSQFYWDRTNNRLGIGTNSPSRAKSKILISSAAEQGLVLQAASSQTGNLTEWRMDNGRVLAKITGDGNLAIGLPNTLATSTPTSIDMGGTFADTVTSTKAKWKLYSDGTPIQTYGIGISAGQMNFFKFAGGSYNWYFSDVEKMRLTTAGNLGIDNASPNSKLTVNGNLALLEGSAPSATTNFGKVYVNSGNSRLYFVDDGGNSYNLTNGSSANVSGSNTWFQFNDSGALGGNGALTFTKGTRILAVANDTPFDINTTTLSIADSDITLDGASTTFTQSSGAITLAPAAGSNVNLTLSGAGDFAVATNKLYVDTSASAVGINDSTPSTALDVTGTINATAQINGVTANFTNANIATLAYIGANTAGAADILLNNGGSAIYNEQGNAVNFRVESDTNANMLFVDGTNNRVGIGTATPSVALDINGGFRVRDGSPQANFVLASVDTTGTTNWKSVSDILNDGGAFLNALNDAISDKSSNLFLGNGSGLTNSGEYNTSVGILSMGANTSGNGNTALGYRAGNPNTTGNYNTAIGVQTLNGNNIGAANIALGYKSLYTTNGDYNIGLGYRAGYATTTGDNNISLGYQAGDNVTTGSRNITIGYDLDAVSATANDQLNIGSAIFGNLGTGNIGIGANNPSAFKLQVTGNIGPTTNNTYDLGSSAIKFANAYANNFNGAAANISTINSATINNTGSAHIAGTVNGGTFDGDFTNGSILFSDAAGVISQNSSQFFWDRVNNRLGIHTRNPLHPLHINGRSLTSDKNASILFATGGVSNWSLGVHNGDSAKFKISNGTALSSQPHFTILKSGNIGVGYTAPTSKLHVNGDTATRSLTLNGNSANIPALSQGSLLFARAASTIRELPKGTNHYTLKVNGNTLAWEVDAGSGLSLLNIDGLSDGRSNASNVFLGNGAGLVDTGTSYSTGVGIMALQNNTAGSGMRNSAFGYQALNGNTTGDENTGIGLESLFSNTTGSYNSGLGRASLRTNTIGSNNTAVGHNSLRSNTSGSANTATGTTALYSNTTGNGNTATGYGAFRTNQTGSNVTAIGYNTAYNSTVGNGTYLGAHAAYSATTGQYNTAIGQNSLYYPTTGQRNTAVGYFAGEGSSGQNFSNGTFLGFNTGVALTTGYNNTVIGFNSGLNVTSGNGNVLLGYLAGDAITTGAKNIVIGRDIDAPSNTGWGQLTIGNLIFGTGVDGTGTTISSGNVGIALASPSEKFAVNGNLALKEGSAPSGTLNFGKVYVNSANHKLYFKDNGGIAYNLVNGSAAVILNIDGLTDGKSNVDAVYLGNGAGLNNSGTTYNSAVGIQALYYSTTGQYNTALGYQAGKGASSNTASSNTFIGGNSGSSIVTGATRNTGLGALSLFTLSSGTDNTAIGESSLRNTSTGIENTGVGSGALYTNTSGASNTAVGFKSLYYPATGFNNTAVGYYAGYGVSSNNFSNGTFLGYKAGTALTTGFANTMVGYSAGLAVTNGNGNILVGYQAGDAITTGARNIVIGYNIDAPSNTARGQLTIGNLIFGNGLTATTGTTISAGKVAINKANPSYTFDVNGTAFSKSQNFNGNSMSIGALSQGSILFAKAAGTLAALDNGASSNHKVLKVNGNTLVWENDAGGAGAALNIDGLTDGKSNVDAVYLGNGAGLNNSGTTYNSAVGIQALYYSTTGQYNTALGYQAGKGASSNTASSNTFIGGNSGSAIVTGATRNTGLGALSLFTLSSGTDNTAIGESSLRNTSTGIENTGVGSGALYTNTSGASNTAVGFKSLYYPATGFNNTAVGYYAGYGVSSNNFSNGTFLGYKAGTALTTGFANTMVGYSAGLAVTNGNGNILVGYQAGDAITTGARNIVIGYNIDAPSNTARGQLTIGNLIFGNGLTATTGTTISGGKVGINKANPAYTLDVNGVTASKTFYSNGTTISIPALSQGSILFSKVAGTLVALDNGASSNHKVLKVNGNTLVWENDAGNSFTGNIDGLSDGKSNTVNVFLGNGSGAADTGTSYSTGVGVESLATNVSASGYHNSAFGYQALKFNSTGDRNVGFGNQTLYTNTSGYENVAVGMAALYYNLTAYYNTAVGYYSQFNNKTGNNNTSLGHQALYNNNGDSSTAVGTKALYSNTQGTNNTAVGYNALYTNSTGANSTAIGYQANYFTTVGNGVALGYKAAYTNSTGAYNTALGHSAIYSNSTGARNTALGYYAAYGSSSMDNGTYLGYYAGRSVSTGDNNTMVGFYAGNGATTGSYSVAVGSNALYFPTTGQRNTAVGYMAGEGTASNNFSNGTFLGYNTGIALTTGFNNTMVGYAAGIAVTNGNGNILMGYQAGDAITTGAKNIIIGRDIDAPSNTAWGQLSIGNLIFGNGMLATGTTISGGKVGINKANPSYTLDVNGVTASKTFYSNGTTISIPALSQGSILFSKVAGTLVALDNGASSNHKVLKVNGNTLAWESVGSSGASNIDGLSDGKANTVNVFLGNGSGASDSGTSYSTGVGIKALQNNTGASGLNNTAVGYMAANGNTTGDNNTVLGYQAGMGASSNTATRNTFIGASSGAVIVTNGDDNTGVGYKSLGSTSSGADNVAVGSYASFSNTTGNMNTVLGRLANYYNQTGSNNIVIGYKAGGYGAGGVNSATNNTFIGYYSAYNNTTAGNGTALGYNSLYSNTTGKYNTALGHSALYYPSTGTRNTAVGYMAGEGTTGQNFSNGTFLGYGTGLALTTGLNNTLIGFQAGNGTTTGSYTVAVGSNALYFPTTGTRNTAVGYMAGEGTTGQNFSNGVFLGYNTGIALTTGFSNTMIGYAAGLAVTNGNGNVLLGYQTGDNITTGARNIVIGYNIDAPAAGGRGQLTIGNLIFGNGLTATTGTTISGGKVGINKANPAYVLDVNGTLAAKTFYSNGTTISIPALSQGSILFAKAAGTLVAFDNGASSNHKVLKINGNTLAWEVAGSSVAGSTKQIQFNNGGTQAASAGLTFNGGWLKVANLITFGSEYSIGNSSTSATVNWNNGAKQYITMTGNCTLTFTAPTAGVTNLLLRVVQDGTGSRTITWPATVKWPSGVAPTLTTTAAGIDIITCYYNATNYYCQASLDFQ